PQELSLTDFEDHFNKYGKINDLTIKSHIGFLNYDSENTAKEVLKLKHVIKGKDIEIDEGREYQNSNQGGYDSRRNERSFRSYNTPQRRDNYGYNNRYENDNKRFSNNSRDDCSYCRKCPDHGVRSYQQKERSEEMKKLDKFKMVIQNTPSFRNSYDLKNFAKSFDLNPTFAILFSGGRSGILEFSSIEEKMEAIKVLSNKNVYGNILGARDFYLDGENEKPKNHEGEEKKSSDLIYGDLDKYNKNS
ncbi:uncharacterized protein, partial [Lepeophtheirus salmonis]|uniref:uncharacterized protein n=1 Tax=Lepeophtheirus salmonis TaxID=72036 RepID=UPI001AE17424